MPHNMVHEVLFPCEALLANITSVRGLARMFSNVVDHVLFSSESLRAEFASVRSFSSVTSNVIVQMLFTGESFVASCACVWLILRHPLGVPFVRVSSKVTFPMP